MILVISLVIYVLLATLTCLALKNARKGRRAPAIVLFLSLLLCTLETCSGLATLGSSLSNSTGTEAELPQLSLWFITVITTNWMLPLLFLSTCLLFRERLVFAKLPDAIPRLRAIVITYWIVFCVIILAGSSVVPFAIAFQRLLWQDGSSKKGGQVFGFNNTPFYTGLSLGMSSLWWLSAIVVIYFAYFTKKSERQFSLSQDKVRTLIECAWL